jgi:MFS transporter, FHS family, L-fucose permease
MTARTNNHRLFVTSDGKNLAFTFILVSSLFLLWGFCNGMIDVMDKHFQDELGLTKSQSAWVQFAHYLGYFLMSIPAGWLAGKLGYKGGIITGLLIVALGGLWFVPATSIQEAARAGTVSPNVAFVGFLIGVCAIATGLTFLETIANPYTTVLGNPRYAATRINLAQSANGVGWILGPIAGGIYFYSKDAHGVSTGSQTLYIPYVGIAAIVTVLAVVFYFANVPDIRSEDDYHLDDDAAVPEVSKGADREVRRGLVYSLLWLNAAVLTCICGMILWLILSACGVGPHLVGIASRLPHPSSMEITAANSLLVVVCTAAAVLIAVLAVALIPVARGISHHSIWSHPHFSGATMAQFFYVAAQAGIFSFLINYMTSEVPAIPSCWLTDKLSSWFETKQGVTCFSDAGAANLASFGFLCFLVGRFTGAILLKKFSAHKVVGLYGLLNVTACLLVFLKLGWLSVVCVFLSYFFMSIMFPTIFALGIFGLGARAKKASAFIVMAIMGGAVLPKAMGYVADQYDMSRGFIVPMVCFVLVALYGLCWPLLSQSQSLSGVKTSGGH